jgi:hypothetical protein
LPDEVAGGVVCTLIIQISHKEARLAAGFFMKNSSVTKNNKSVIG